MKNIAIFCENLLWHSPSIINLINILKKKYSIYIYIINVPEKRNRDYLNKGLNRIRVSLTHTDKVFPHEEMEEERKICKQLKEYVEGINPDLIHKELPYYYSKFLDEFMLCLIDGVENTTSRSSRKYKNKLIFREIGEMSLEERLKTVSKDNGKKYRSKRLKEMGDGMYKWDYVQGLIEKI